MHGKGNKKKDMYLNPNLLSNADLLLSFFSFERKEEHTGEGKKCY